MVGCINVGERVGVVVSSAGSDGIRDGSCLSQVCASLYFRLGYLDSSMFIHILHGHVRAMCIVSL